MRLLVCALFAPALLAQNFTRPKVMTRPILPPLSKPWKTVGPRILLAGNPGAVAEVKKCAVPLLQAAAPSVDEQMVIVPPSSGFAMRFVNPPAPPCDEKPRP